MSIWKTIIARVVRGHQVASGRNGDPRFPGGTLRMQHPHFKALGLDLGAFHPGTLNVSISPGHYHVGRARHTFHDVKWHPVEPAESFSFFDVRLLRPSAGTVAGFIYFPHPESKPEHFQQPDVLELLLPFVEGMEYGAEVILEIPTDQLVVETGAKIKS